MTVGSVFTIRNSVDVFFILSVSPYFKVKIFIQNIHLIVLAYRRVLKPQEVCITECGVLPHNSCVTLLKMGSAEFNHCPYLRIQGSSYPSVFQYTFNFQLSSEQTFKPNLIFIFPFPQMKQWEQNHSSIQITSDVEEIPSKFMFV
jgi:hypothetical protein